MYGLLGERVFINDSSVSYPQSAPNVYCAYLPPPPSLRAALPPALFCLLRHVTDLLNAFVYGLSVKKWVDVAVISPPNQLDSLNCTGENDVALSGFDCLFRPMPHVCTFDSIAVSIILDFSTCDFFSFFSNRVPGINHQL